MKETNRATVIQDVQFEQKRSTRKFNVGTKACAKRERERGAWRETVEREVKREWCPQDTHTTQLPLQLMKAKGLRDFLLLKSN